MDPPLEPDSVAREFEAIARDIRKDYDESNAWLLAHEDDAPASITARAAEALFSGASSEEVEVLRAARDEYQAQYDRNCSTRFRLRALQYVRDHLDSSIRGIFQQYNDGFLVLSPAEGLVPTTVAPRAARPAASHDARPQSKSDTMPIYEDPDMPEEAQHGSSEEPEALRTMPASQLNENIQVGRHEARAKMTRRSLITSDFLQPATSLIPPDETQENRATGSASDGVGDKNTKVSMFKSDETLLKKLNGLRELARLIFRPECPLLLQLDNHGPFVEFHCPCCKTNTSADGEFLNGIVGLIDHIKDEHKDLYEEEVKADPILYVFNNGIKCLVDRDIAVATCLDPTLQERLGKGGVPVAYDKSSILRLEHDKAGKDKNDTLIARLKCDPSIICIIKNNGRKKSFVRLRCKDCGVFGDKHRNIFTSVQELQDHVIDEHDSTFDRSIRSLMSRCKVKDLPEEKVLDIQMKCDAGLVYSPVLAPTLPSSPVPPMPKSSSLKRKASTQGRRAGGKKNKTKESKQEDGLVNGKRY